MVSQTCVMAGGLVVEAPFAVSEWHRACGEGQDVAPNSVQNDLRPRSQALVGGVARYTRARALRARGVIVAPGPPETPPRDRHAEPAPDLHILRPAPVAPYCERSLWA